MKVFDVSKTAAVYVYGEPVSMANGFKGLRNFVVRKLKKEADNGDIFLFVNNAQNYLKALFYDNDGWCILSKKLPRGIFDVESVEGQIEIKDMSKLVNNVLLTREVVEAREAA